MPASSPVPGSSFRHPDTGHLTISKLFFSTVSSLADEMIFPNPFRVSSVATTRGTSSTFSPGGKLGFRKFSSVNTKFVFSRAGMPFCFFVSPFAEVSVSFRFILPTQSNQLAFTKRANVLFLKSKTRPGSRGHRHCTTKKNNKQRRRRNRTHTHVPNQHVHATNHYQKYI